MKRIMKVAALTACVGAMLCFAGCGKGDADKGATDNAKVVSQGKSAKDVTIKGTKSEDDPGKIILSVLNAMAKGEADDAFIKSHCTKDSAEFLIGWKEMMQACYKGATFEIESIKITGDEAVVMFKQNGGAGAGETAKWPVKKVNGHWKVNKGMNVIEN